jgi:hypothetical protein
VARDLDVFARAARLADAYGLEARDRERVVELQLNQAERAWHLMRWRAEHLGGGWQRMWEGGVGGRIVRRRAWLAANADRLAAATRAR